MNNKNSKNWKGEKNVTLDEPLIVEVFGRVFEAYARSAGVFAEHRAETAGPQHVFKPKRVALGGADHRYWLALVAMSDRRTSSRFLYRNFATMFDRNPTLFARGRYQSLRRMAELFRRYQIALPVKEIALFLKRKRHLDELFGGDPLKVYEGAPTAALLMAKFKRVAREHGERILFPGAKEKIFSLLAMFLREYAALDFADVVPVDVWVQSICASTGGLAGTGMIKVQALERLLRPIVTASFAGHREVEGAANATWILGKHGCANCGRLDMSLACPVYALCDGPFIRLRHPTSNKHYGGIQLPLSLIPKKSPG